MHPELLQGHLWSALHHVYVKCVSNPSRFFLGLIRHLHKEEGADTFVPILIYTVLKANPQHLLSNVE